MKKDSLFKGTFILSVSLIFTKIIGLLYISPFYSIMGGERNIALYTYSYNYYVILLEISSAGIPLTIAKLIAKYNAELNFEKSKRIAKVGSYILLTSGILGFLFLFLGADYLAGQTISTKDASNYSVADLALVIRTLSLAVPIVMITSGLRGMFQGHEIMLPSAVSQFFEQLVRVIAVLLGSYFVMQITNKNLVYTNAMATFATSLGAITALLILLFYYKKYRKYLEFNQKNVKKHNLESTFSVVKEILYVSIPFVVVSSFFAILNLIDQNTVVNIMHSIDGKGPIGEKEFVIYSNLVNKIVMISVALAPAFTGVFLPAVTKLYTENKIQEVSKQFNKVMLALLMFILPALVGMFILAEPLYNSFYKPTPEAYSFVRLYLPLALCYSIYGMTGIIMQAINKQKFNVLIIVVGLLFKYSLNAQFIIRFETKGALYCSILTYLLMIFLTLIVIHYEVNIRISEFARNLFRIMFACFIMFIVVSAFYQAILPNFDLFRRIDNIILLGICACIGAPIYFLTLKNIRFLNYLFGRNINLKQLIRRR